MKKYLIQAGRPWQGVAFVDACNAPRALDKYLSKHPESTGANIKVIQGEKFESYGSLKTVEIIE